jgi:hypothetical protein
VFENTEPGMTRCTTTIAVILVTVAATVAIWLWALEPLGFVSYLTSPGASAGDIIRQYWPHRLVEPEWVSTTPDTLTDLINWNFAETKARLAVVAVLWFVIAGVATYGWSRRREQRSPSR